jgi:hypothetical protein
MRHHKAKVGIILAAILAMCAVVYANTTSLRQTSEDDHLRGGRNGSFSDENTEIGFDDALWTFGPSLNFSRYGLDVIEHDGKIYAIGGWDDASKLEALDTDGDSWDELQSLPTGQAGVAAALVGDNIYTMGSYGGSSICQIYDIVTDSWQSGPDIPIELYWATAEAVGNSVYLIGGWEPWGQGDLDTLYILNTLSNTWTQGANLPSAIQIPSSAVYDNQIYVFGQGVYYRYDIVTDSWDVFPAPPSGHGYAAEAVTVGDKIYLFGGNSGPVDEAFKTVEIYDTASQTWEVGPELQIGRYQFGGCYAKGKIYVIGGRDENALPLDSVEVLLNPCQCDLSRDGACNILDWPYFIEDWGRIDCNDPGVECECDLNGDGSCNILDWPYFIEDWGRTDCPSP